jgi:serine/threonine-protein kinase
MRQKISGLAKLVLAVGVAVPALAWAQASPQAEALFRDGKQLMKEGKTAEACAAFEGSERAEHNVATVMSLADCREKNRQYASAWALFLQADSQTRSDPSKAALNTTAKKRAIALESRLSYLTINVPDESRVPELVVTRDGVPVDQAEWNRSIPADGGEHVIAGKAPGHEPWSTTVTLRPSSDKQSVEVPKFKALPEIVNKKLRADEAEQQAPSPAEPSPFTPKRKIGIGVAAGGVVVAGVAVGLGLQARNLRNDAVATCPPSACSPQNALDAQRKNDSARSYALVANVGYGVAAGAVIAGAVLWFIGPPESQSAVAIVPQVGTSNGVAVMGRF